MYGFREHPLRQRLHNEVHARPPNALVAPSQISHLALLSPRENGDKEEKHLAELARLFSAVPPEPNTNHYSGRYSGDFGTILVNWERHTEFARYSFIRSVPEGLPFETSVLDELPAEWVAALEGEVIAAIDVALVAGPLPDRLDSISEDYFAGNTMIASMVGDRAATAFTDLRIRENGRSRILVYDFGMSPRQAGRVTQRLLEIETYRMMALLALPYAQSLRPFLEQSERELAALTGGMAGADHEDDAKLLKRLTALETAIQGRQADSHYRLSAAAAYYEIVERRIEELREERVSGFQTFREFVERRLVPAMSTCRSAAESAAQLSERIARSTALLSTRVEFARQAQNRALLASVARRAKMQLRLQQTVEGLSVAAITYYIVGLVGYAAKALTASGLKVPSDVIVGLSVPVVLMLVTFGITRIRHLFKTPK